MPPKEKISSLAGKLNKSTFFGTSANLPKVLELDIVKLEPNPDQPRKTFDEKALRELADSIETHGLIQPITVKPIPETERFMIVAGERRWRAHQLLDRQTIFAITTDGNTDEIALIENIQRENLHPLEEAAAFAQLMERHQYTQEQLGKAVGKAKSTVSELLSLNSLPEEIKGEVRTSELLRPGKSVLIEIARLADRDKQLLLWQQVKEGKATVKSAREKKGPGRDRPTVSRYGRVLGTIQRLLSEVEAVEALTDEEHAQLETYLRDLSRLAQAKKGGSGAKPYSDNA